MTLYDLLQKQNYDTVELTVDRRPEGFVYLARGFHDATALGRVESPQSLDDALAHLLDADATSTRAVQQWLQRAEGRVFLISRNPILLGRRANDQTRGVTLAVDNDHAYEIETRRLSQRR